MGNMDDLTLNKFKENIGLGTRPNRFDVNMVIPGSAKGGGEFTMTTEVAAASLPASVVNPIFVPFRGRTLKIPGDRQYGSWNFTVIDPQPNIQQLWQNLHGWSDKINDHVTNETDWSPEAADNFTANWTIHHHALNGGLPIKEITLYNCWPTMVGEFALNHSAADQLSSFSVTVEYEYFDFEKINVSGG